ncbi:sensor histidine kinase [Saccharibacillus kuerlensis]|uniref:histidine kinase n=1 Tax=Saccharibacillus kuerlensis TaxID=459527 RepID=A0ABQ2L6V5_9BACL|nr:HAMP domain-containing sensor histidine kinase [Saccharibacillus kuerlensis]GGO05366.1 two-component sensor histidine kinase [Saccharibacillus kuerlensis]
MTIKRRLFISNILMIVIPIVLAIMLSILGTFLLWMNFGYEFRNSNDYYEGRDTVMAASQELLQNSDASEVMQLDFLVERIERLLQKNDMALRIYETDTVTTPSGGSASESASETDIDNQTGSLRYSLGKKVFVDPQLTQALEALGGTGIVGKDGHELYVKKVSDSVTNKTYRIELFSTRETSSPADQDDRGSGWIPLSLLLGMFTVVFFTSRFLTRFVFQKIRHPLQILADGVTQIRDGNLDYRIQYTRKDEFRPVCEAFNEMAGRLKESVWAVQKQELNRKELMAGISHDLRSPLTSIKAYAEGLLDGVASNPESQRRYVTMIKTKAEDIDHMVSRLFLFSKMDLGDYPNYPEYFDPREQLETFFLAAAEEHAEQGLRVSFGELEEGLMLYADPVQFRRVLANIVENSMKYKEREDVTVSVEAREAGGRLRIKVEDDGPGVTDEALPKLFDVFYRGDASRSSPDRGSGLGLAISEKAIAFMDGSIRAEHGTGGGLRIVIELPVQKKKEE